MTSNAYPRKRRTWPFLVAAAAFVFCIVGVIASMAGGNPTPESPGTAVGIAAGQAATKAAPSAKPKATLGAANLKLTVKTTDKACFGSAGCNVQYSIRVAYDTATLPDECEITYQVDGLDDPQVGTLTLTSDGKYSQDNYQAGQTPRSSSKLTAKVTDVECR